MDSRGIMSRNAQIDDDVLQRAEIAESSFDNYAGGRSSLRAGRHEQQRDTAGALAKTRKLHQNGMNDTVWIAPQQGKFKCNVDAAKLLWNKNVHSKRP